MPQAATYSDYISSGYLEYQKRYAGNMRQSDRVLIELVRGSPSLPRRGANA